MDQRLDGLDASVQVIQLGERGTALYNVSYPSLHLFHPQISVHHTPPSSPSSSSKLQLILSQCADIRFNSTATLLADDKCVNGTGVSGTMIGSLQDNAAASPTGSAVSSETSGPASRMGTSVGGSVVAAVLAWGLL